MRERRGRRGDHLLSVFAGARDVGGYRAGDGGGGRAGRGGRGLAFSLLGGRAGLEKSSLPVF